MKCEAPVSVATLEQKLLRLEQLAPRDVVSGNVKPLRSLRHSYQQRRAELRHKGKVDLSPKGRNESMKGPVVERDDVHPIAVIEIALHNRAQRIIIVDVLHRQDDHAGLGSGRVIQPEPHSGGRRVLRPRNRRQSDGAQHRQQINAARFHHFRNSGSKLNTTGRTSSGKPSGSGPTRRALDAASTAPCASRSKEKLPERLMKVRSDTEPSRCIRNLISALRRAVAFLGLKLSAICRTMLLRYPGNGNSIPSLRTVATSVPFPPREWPHTLGASVFSCAPAFESVAPTFGAGFDTLGVAREGVFCAGFALGSGISLSVDCAALGCVTAVVALACPLFTSPMALSPGGAATIETRYIGGKATVLRSLRGLERSVATAA